MPQRAQRVGIGVFGFATFLALWQAGSSAGILRALLFSSPAEIARQIVVDAQTSTFWRDIGVTLEEWWLGFAAAAVLGIVIGLFAGWYRRVRRVAEPWLNVLYAVPFLAVVPLFILWFGIGLEFKVVVAFISALFVVAINTMAGVHATDQRLLAVGDTFGASRPFVFRTIVLPGSVPYIMTGLRQGAGHSLVGAVAAEFIASNQGLGFRIISAGQTLNTPEVMIGIVLLAMLGMVSGGVFQLIENRFQHWRPRAR
jgi:NitT/TauT family transport system permease protein